ncbi:MAG: hypothetical protein JNL70_22495 [Saprospiraceae bacterium]|nr:hypothetical protein [Saprospiraceae bacterium]
MANNSYSCSQADLYNVCRTGWNSCGEHLAAFAAYKPKYTEGLVAQNISDINAADALDDLKSRFSGRRNLRTDLTDKKEDALFLYHQLTGYINDAYPKDKVKKMLNAAGQDYYKKAKSCNWSSVTALMNSAIPFITNNAAELSAKDNMPADFLGKFQAVKVEFDAIHESLKSEEGTSSKETSKKQMANNDIFNNLKVMLKDAKIIFRRDPAILKKFTLATLMPKSRTTKTAQTGEKAVTKTKRKTKSKTTVTATSEALETPQKA